MQLYLQREEEKTAAEKLRLQQEAAKTWKQLLHSMWTRLQLQRKYGAAAIAAAAGGSDGVKGSDTQGMLQREQLAAAGKARQIIQGLHAQKDFTAGVPAEASAGQLNAPKSHAGLTSCGTGVKVGTMSGAALARQQQLLPPPLPPSHQDQQQAGGEETNRALMGVDVEEF